MILTLLIFHDIMKFGFINSFFLFLFSLFFIFLCIYEWQVPYSGGKGLLTLFSQIHGPNSSKLMMSTIYLPILVNCLCAFQVYDMVVFDNFEGRYTSKKNQPCTLWVHTCIRVGYGGLAFFLSFCDFPIFAKPSTSSWRCYITFNFCLSMFHVDCNEETSTKWFGLVYKHGVRLLWHCLDYSNSYCSGLDLSWQWTKSQLLQALMTDTLVRN